MYATATSSSANTFGPRNMTNAYRQIDVETSVNGASPHQLTLMLLNGAMDAMNRAKGAMANGEVEAKGKAISKAIGIIDEGLRASLNMAEGGELATRLSDLYAYITTRLTQANARNDVAALEECVTLLTPIRDAWVAIAPTSDSPASTAAMRIQA